MNPEYIRLKDVPRLFGLGRTTAYELIASNKIRTVSLRKPGQRHGTRLISYSSLKDYLASLEEGGKP